MFVDTFCKNIESFYKLFGICNKFRTKFDLSLCKFRDTPQYRLKHRLVSLTVSQICRRRN